MPLAYAAVHGATPSTEDDDSVDGTTTSHGHAPDYGATYDAFSTLFSVGMIVALVGSVAGFIGLCCTRADDPEVGEGGAGS